MKPKQIELLAFNKKEKLQYEGCCKLRLAVISNLLIVEPFDEECKMISVSFNWQYITQKNILFVFAENSFQDFVLVFDNEARCKKVYDIIHRKKSTNNSFNNIELERLLIPIMDAIKSNPTSSAELERILTEWISKLDEKTKESYVKLLKKNYISDLIVLKQMVEKEKSCAGDKRKYSQMNNKNERKNQLNSESERNKKSGIGVAVRRKAKTGGKKRRLQVATYKIMIYEPKFKLVNILKDGRLLKRLLVFTSDAKTHCYEYSINSEKTAYFCRGCNKLATSMSAILENGSNGLEFIKLEEGKHVCSPYSYNAANYVERKIMKKPEYEILENCKTATGKLLFIFDKSDRNQCYKYYWDNTYKLFYCCGCQKRQIKARLFCENTENEYLEIDSDNHRCKKQNYEPQKYQQFNKFVLSPNFEIRSKIEFGKGKKQLIIFDSADKTQCYVYQYYINGNYFTCNGCQNRNVHAKVAQNADGEDYIISSPTDHTCSSRPYIPESEEILIHSPDFKFLEKSLQGPPKLIIFDTNDNSMCYVFSPVCRLKNNRYHCCGCAGQRVEKEKLVKRMDGRVVKGIVMIDLCKDESGDYYVRATNQRHICNPKKYEPEKYEPRKPMDPTEYFYFRPNDKPKSLYIAVYHPNDKNLCYKLYYSDNNNFKCSYCSNHHRKKVTIKHYFERDGNEYVVSNSEKHSCKPYSVSSLKQSGIKILKSSGLSAATKPAESKKQEEEVDKTRIVKSPNFELRRDKYGTVDKKLIILHSTDKSLCYELTFCNSKKKYYCGRCSSKKHRVYVNVKIDKNEEKYVILDKKEHVCEALKYKPENEIIETPNFAVFNKDDKNKPTKLVIFTSPEKDYCYQLTYSATNKSYICRICQNIDKKKIIFAKICLHPNGEEYVQMLSNGHICAPRKFVSEELNPKTISASGFKLYDGGRGRPNTRLVVFHEEKKDFVYEYILDQRVYYTCVHCKMRKATVTAKLQGIIQENTNGSIKMLQKLFLVLFYKDYANLSLFKTFFITVFVFFLLLYSDFSKHKYTFFMHVLINHFITSLFTKIF